MAQFGLGQEDMDQVKSYVTAQDHLQYSLLPEDMVAVLITHCNLSAKHIDIRFNLHSTIADVKTRLKLHVGTPVEHQRLIHRINGNNVQELADNSRMLGFYSVESGHEIHIIDTDPFSLSRGGGLTDVSLVEKFRMTDDDYDKRSGTMRDYIRKKRAEDPTFKLKPKSVPPPGVAGQPLAPETGPETVAGIAVGNRCQVMPGKRRGVVMTVGEVEGLKAGHWVGIKFDEPVGTNDGTVKGVKIFECEDGFGSFVRGKNVTVGDFPERDIMDDDSDDEEEAGGVPKEAVVSEAVPVVEKEEEEEDEI